MIEINNSTYQQNRESDDEKLIRLTKKLNSLNLKVEEARQKIITKLGKTE
jgi:hypothetical protein